MADVFQLKCAVQQYAWGKIGKDSEVAKLSKAGLPNFQIEADKPYAELWMGTHPKGPSVILDSDGKEKLSLAEWINAHPKALGKSVEEKFGDSLPFLFKVLSVNKSLSIQAHPNKSHAEQLHNKDPKNYPDPNHKPEMAIALTPFEGLCGFRPVQDIVAFLKAVPEFAAVIGKDATDELTTSVNSSDVNKSRDALKKCFTRLMTCDVGTIQKNLASLVQRLENTLTSGQSVSEELGKLLLRLNSQFPGDGGCFCIYFMNYMKLEPGQAMFLEANLPHAYLSGDCMECMACSDNVVRAGLTPKFKDVPTLCEMLNYSPKPAADNLFPSASVDDDPYTTLYNPPVPDFAVAKIQIPSGVPEYTMQAVDSASIVLVVEGQGESISEGHSLVLKQGVVFFITANQKLSIKVQSGLIMFRAMCML